MCHELCSALGGYDVVNRDPGDRLPVALGLAIPHLRLVFDDDDLWAPTLLDHATHDLCAVDQRAALPDAVLVGHQQNLGELDGLALFDRELLDLNRLARLDAMLLAAGLDNCERHPCFLCLF